MFSIPDLVTLVPAFLKVKQQRRDVWIDFQRVS
jgi:hypothetical protein